VMEAALVPRHNVLLYARGRTWHRTQEISEQRNGCVRIAFVCRNLAPVTSWILEWGPHAKVLEPPVLVNEVVRELQGALGHTDDFGRNGSRGG